MGAQEPFNAFMIFVQEVPTGEEDEDEIYSQRSKLYARGVKSILWLLGSFGSTSSGTDRFHAAREAWCRYRFKDGEWKERGLGDSKLLRHRVGRPGRGGVHD